MGHLQKSRPHTLLCEHTLWRMRFYEWDMLVHRIKVDTFDIQHRVVHGWIHLPFVYIVHYGFSTSTALNFVFKYGMFSLFFLFLQKPSCRQEAKDNAIQK